MPDSQTDNDDLVLYQIAKMYYIDGMTQDAISRTTCFSRSYISRLLKRAQERNIVSFVVTNPLEQIIGGLEAHLRDLYGLKYIVVEGVTSDEYQGTSRRPLIDCLAERAARCLPDFLATSSSVAVGLGRTLYTLSKSLRQSPLSSDTVIMPAIGTTTATDPQTQSNIIADNISSALGARRYFTNVPVIADASEAKSKLYQRRRDELTRRWDTVDTAVVGLGAPYHSPADPFSLNEASDEYRERVANANVAGDVLASFFFEDGAELELGPAYVRNSICLDHLKRIDRVLCIAGGPRKVRGIRTALRNGFANCLITDSITAAEIVALEEGDHSANR